MSASVAVLPHPGSRVVEVGWTLPAAEPWTAAALCAGHDADVWFPHPTDMRGEEAAKAVCRECDVAVECLRFALTLPEPVYGVWGGLSSDERRRLKRRINRK